MSLTQKEFEFLIGLNKRFSTSEELPVNSTHQRWSREVASLETNDKFIIDFHKGKMELNKYSINNRYRKVICLIRLDTVGRHTNPDGVLIEGPHVHIFREGFDDKFAFQISEVGLDNVDVLEETLLSFLRYCNITNIPPIQGSFFSNG